MMWMVRADGGDLTADFLGQGIASVGWSDAGDLTGLDRDQIIDLVMKTWPEYRRMQAIVAASQLDKMVNAMTEGDRVISYDPSSRVYHVGSIVGSYEHVLNVDDQLTNRRRVRWEGAVSRDDLTTPSKNSLGSSLSIFQVPLSVEAEIQTILGGRKTVEEPQDYSETDADLNTALILDDLAARAKEFIKDKVADLDWEQLQELVAGILRAMNYKTKVSPRGSDRGKDIIASPDGLGFESPRIVVEVKHRPGTAMGSQEIRSFLGGRHRDDRGLYVSTGGFSKDAKYEADRAAIPLTLMDLDELVDLFTQYYDTLDLRTRTIVPLARIYWPS